MDGVRDEGREAFVDIADAVRYSTSSRRHEIAPVGPAVITNGDINWAERFQRWQATLDGWIIRENLAGWRCRQVVPLTIWKGLREHRKRRRIVKNIPDVVRADENSAAP